MIGATQPAHRPVTIPCFDPATLAPLGEARVTPPPEVATIVRAARQAQERWAETSFGERRRVLRLLLDRILDRTDELCGWVVTDTGKTRENALLGEIWPVCEKLRWTIAHGERHLRPERVSSGLFWHKRATIDYRPLGVIGVIAPWNYPLQNLLGPVVPALMAGNACVVKPSEWVAWSSTRVGDLVGEVLREAGHPPELVSLVHGYADTGQALIGAGVDKLVFTGSVPNGRKVIAASAECLVPLILELGGKDAFIVCADADLEQAVHAALAGVFINAGQNCLAAERLLVFDGIYDHFEQRVLELARGLRQGRPDGPEPVDVGAMVSPLQVDLVERMVARAVEQGARVLLGGRRPREQEGQFYPPTILADVTPEMEIMREELFGPVMLLCRVRDEDHAITVANDTAFGLCATVLTRDAARARRLGRRLVTGGVSVNDFGLTYMAQDLPFGGAKASGFGRLNGRDGLRAFTNAKAVLADRFPLHVPTKLYPVGRRDYDLAREVVQTLYRRGAGARLGAAWRLVAVLIRREGAG